VVPYVLQCPPGRNIQLHPVYCSLYCSAYLVEMSNCTLCTVHCTAVPTWWEYPTVPCVLRCLPGENIQLYPMYCSAYLVGISTCTLCTAVPTWWQYPTVNCVLQCLPGGNIQLYPVYCSAYLVGISNCTWTSCRHGCTSDIFKCWHILVNFTLGK
jgi:hypothetical protein